MTVNLINSTLFQSGKGEEQNQVWINEVSVLRFFLSEAILKQRRIFIPKKKVVPKKEKLWQLINSNLFQFGKKEEQNQVWINEVSVLRLFLKEVIE